MAWSSTATGCSNMAGAAAQSAAPQHKAIGQELIGGLQREDAGAATDAEKVEGGCKQGSGACGGLSAATAHDAFSGAR